MSKIFKGLKKIELNSTKTPSTMPLSGKCKMNAEGSVFHEKQTYEYSSLTMNENPL
jgi:hypothetical protein